MADRAIERVVCGDGTADEWGIIWPEGPMYGNDKIRGAGNVLGTTIWVAELL